MKPSVFSDNDVLDPRFADTMFVVEANSFEQHTLWERFHEGFDWVQEGMGTVYQTGWVGKRPVVTSMFWVLINGCRVLFYDNTSEVVDHKQVENWFKKNCNPKWDNGTRRAHTDAMNFHLCIHAVQESNERALVNG